MVLLLVANIEMAMKIKIATKNIIERTPFTIHTSEFVELKIVKIL